MFIMRPRPVATSLGASPVINDPGDVHLTDPCAQFRCADEFQTMLKGYPAYANCLQSNPAHLAYYKNLCCQMHLGKIAPNAATQQWLGYMTGQCQPQPQSSQPPATVPPPQDPCMVTLQAWRNSNPTLDQCLTAADRTSMVTMCHASMSGRMTQAQSIQAIQNIVNAACARKTGPQSANKPPISVPPSPPLPGDSSSKPSGDVSRDTGPQGVTQKKPSVLRTMGPIVGIGLIAAIALTAARKGK